MTDIIRKHSNDRMSQLVIHGETIYLAGQVANPGASVTEQAQGCLEQVDALLGSDAGECRILR